MHFQGLDHLAIAVPDTEVALKTWRDKLGFPVLFSETVNDDTVLLTHLDLGNCHLQLVESLVENSPLDQWVKQTGGGLHHFCLKVSDISEAFETVAAQTGISPAPRPHQGTQGNRALFLDKTATDGVQVELTGK
ncbi:MAG: VOC family protein [Cytophagaceae bacterium]|nr:VOC family protein [Cytophagaceae bacterium]